MHNCLGGHDIFNSVGFFGIVKIGEEFASSATGFRYVKVNVDEAEPRDHYEVEIFGPKTLVYLNQTQPRYDPLPRSTGPIRLPRLKNLMPAHVASAIVNGEPIMDPELTPAEMREILNRVMDVMKIFLAEA